VKEQLFAGFLPTYIEPGQLLTIHFLSGVLINGKPLILVFFFFFTCVIGLKLLKGNTLYNELDSYLVLRFISFSVRCFCGRVS